MSINEVLLLLASGLAGMAIGIGFFGGLWWTVQHAMSAERPALWHVASSLLRTATALLGFYWVGDGNWQRLLACLVGFLIGRALVMRWTRTAQVRRTGSQEVGHAPQP